jgi:hypothetical protein
MLPSVCDTALPVQLSPSLTISLSLSPASIGLLPQGLRNNIYVTGGTLQEVGGSLTGNFQAVGADWWNLRRDGVLEVGLVAPVVQTNEGTFAEIRQTGRGDLGPNGFFNFLQRIVPSKIPLRSVVEFGTPLGSSIERFNATRLLGVGYVQPATLTATFDAVYAMSDQTDASFCVNGSPVAVQRVASFKLKAWDSVSFTKADADQVIQYTYGPSLAFGPELSGAVLPGATLVAKVHPDGIADVRLQATVRTVTGESILITSGGRANFAAQGGSLIPIRIQPDVLAEGTKLDALNRNSMLLVGDLKTPSGEVVLHLYRMPAPS